MQVGAGLDDLEGGLAVRQVDEPELFPRPDRAADLDRVVASRVGAQGVPAIRAQRVQRSSQRYELPRLGAQGLTAVRVDVAESDVLGGHEVAARRLERD